MEDNVAPFKRLTPAVDGINDSKHFLDLDVLTPEVARTASRELFRTHMATQAFGSTGISVNIDYLL